MRKLFACALLAFIVLTNTYLFAKNADSDGKFTWQSDRFQDWEVNPGSPLEVVGGFRIGLGDEIPGNEPCEQKAIRESTRLEIKRRGLDSDADMHGPILPQALVPCSALRIGDRVLVLHHGKFLLDSVGNYEYHNNIEVGPDDHAIHKLVSCRSCDFDLQLIAVSGTTQVTPEALTLTAGSERDRAIFSKAFKGVFGRDGDELTQLNGMSIQRITNTVYHLGIWKPAVGYEGSVYVSDGEHVTVIGRRQYRGAVSISGRIFLLLQGTAASASCDGLGLFELNAAGLRCVRYRTISCGD
jgi:hypothetical protein